MLSPDFMPASTALPIWKIHADLLRTLRGGNRLVLVAPTGSGKTTQVPQMLLDAGIASYLKAEATASTPSRNTVASSS